jgi:hypothetical protein
MLDDLRLSKGGFEPGLADTFTKMVATFGRSKYSQRAI